MNAKQEIAYLLHKQGAYCGSCDYETPECSDCKEVLNGYADALIAAGFIRHQTIDTYEELEALAIDSIVIDSDDASCQKDFAGVWAAGCELIRGEEVALPATVLWEPSKT